MTQTQDSNTQQLGSEAIPQSWTWTTLSEIGTVASGGTPKTKDPSNFDGDVPWITPADLSGYSEKTIMAGRRNISRKGLNSSSARLLPQGTVLFSSRAPVGYVAVAANPLTTNQGFKSLIPDEGIFNEYLYYYLKGSKQLAESYASGTTFRELSARAFSTLPIPLPPTSEQRRIVEKIEELFTKLDAGIRSLKQTRTLLKRYRQSVLKAGVDGNLSQEWREALVDEPEPASELLKRISKERRDRFIGKKYKEPMSPDIAKLPTLPQGWVWSNLAELKSFSLYGPRFSSDDYVDSGTLVLRTSDINDSGKVNYATAPKLPLTPEDFRKYKVEVGDLLVTRTGSLGTLAVFNDRFDAIPGAYLIQYRILAPVITSWYIFYMMKSPDGQRALLGGGAGVGRPNLNAPTIEAIPIPVPPLREQRFIVEEVERRLSVVDKLEASVEANLKQAEGLRQSILRQAFSGELVPQDPNEEPASVLLERIGEERQAAKPEIQKKRAKPKRDVPADDWDPQLFPRQGG